MECQRRINFFVNFLHEKGVKDGMANYILNCEIYEILPIFA